MSDPAWLPGCPDYYKTDTYDVIDFVQKTGLNFTLGCVIKYVCRAGRKPGSPLLHDLKKARECLDREIAFYETDVTNDR